MTFHKVMFYAAPNGTNELQLHAELATTSGFTLAALLEAMASEVRQAAEDDMLAETSDRQTDDVKRLSEVIMEIPGEPSQSQGAIDTAIRLLRQAYQPTVKTDPDAEPFRLSDLGDAIQAEDRCEHGDSRDDCLSCIHEQQAEADKLARQDDWVPVGDAEHFGAKPVHNHPEDGPPESNCPACPESLPGFAHYPGDGCKDHPAS